MAWDAALDRELSELAKRSLGGEGVPSTEALSAWRELMRRLAPEAEAWAAGNWMLRRWGLNGPDDARAVMVSFFERLAANQRRSLRAYLERRGAWVSAETAEPDERELAGLTRLWGGLSEPELDPETGPQPPTGSSETPLRAWLLVVMRRVASDHLRQRLGWRGSQDPARGTKRDVATGAAPLEGLSDPAYRPPITDWMALRALQDEVAEVVASFPPELARSWERWIAGQSPADQARAFGLDAQVVERNLRAAKARLRERFRGRADSILRG